MGGKRTDGGAAAQPQHSSIADSPPWQDFLGCRLTSSVQGCAPILRGLGNGRWRLALHDRMGSQFIPGFTSFAVLSRLQQTLCSTYPKMGSCNRRKIL